MPALMKEKYTFSRAKRAKNISVCLFLHRNLHFCWYGCAKMHCLTHPYNSAKAYSTTWNRFGGVRRQPSCTSPCVLQAYVFVSGSCSVKARMHSAECMPPQCKRYLALFARKVSVVISGKHSLRKKNALKTRFRARSARR